MISAKRIETELLLETTTREAKYSTSLSSLMQREENLLRSGADCNDIQRTVDTNLQRETAQFYTTTLKSNVTRWMALNAVAEQQVRMIPVDIRTLSISDVKDKSQTIHRAVGPSINHAVKSTHAITSEELEVENLRLLHDYNENWLHYEGFNLDEAFRLQNVKIETEWKTYEKSLTTKLGQLNESSLDPRWHHPEKQRRLIHTAPVLSPNARIARASDLSSHSYAEESDEVKRIKAALDTLLLQKTISLRWMSRQRIRLQAQAGAIQEERKHIAKVIKHEMALLNSKLVQSNLK